jgi:hypothetical protein
MSLSKTIKFGQFQLKQRELKTADNYIQAFQRFQGSNPTNQGIVSSKAGGEGPAVGAIGFPGSATCFRQNQTELVPTYHETSAVV